MRIVLVYLIITCALPQIGKAQLGNGLLHGSWNAASLSSGGHLIRFEPPKGKGLIIQSFIPYGIQELCSKEASLFWLFGSNQCMAGFGQLGNEDLLESTLFFEIGRWLTKQLFLSVSESLYFFNSKTLSDFSSKITMYSNLCCIYKVGKKQSIAILVVNPTGATTRYRNQTSSLYQTFRIGTDYNPIKQTHFMFELGKTPGKNLTFHTGIKYQAFEALGIRTGFSTQPRSPSWGIGGHWKKINYEFGWSSDPVLGINRSLSLSYQIK